MTLGIQAVKPAKPTAGEDSGVQVGRKHEKMILEVD